MPRHPTFATALVVAGIALLVAPALFPIQPVHVHDTRRGTTQDRAQLEAEGYQIVAYENLSERGQRLYVRTLREGGEYHVPAGTGAPEFTYPTRGDLADVRDHRERETRRSVVIERPADGDLPPPDEPVRFAGERREPRKETAEDERGGSRQGTAEDERRATPTDSPEDRRRQIARFDLMTTTTERPPLTARASLLRLLAVVAGVVALGAGGYVRSRP